MGESGWDELVARGVADIGLEHAEVMNALIRDADGDLRTLRAENAKLRGLLRLAHAYVVSDGGETLADEIDEALNVKEAGNG